MALSLLTAACGLFKSQGPSDVARGEYHAAGRPEYDAFFIELHRLQVDLLKAPDDPQRARESLTRAAGLTSDASDESLRARLAREASTLEGRGLRLRLELPDPSTTTEASATLHTSDGTLGSPLGTTLSVEATRLVRSRNRMLLTQEQLEKLRVSGIQLEGNVEQAFRVEGPWKRDEVRLNLSDGQKLITLMLARARDVQTQAQALLALVASATTTDPQLGKTPVAPPAERAESTSGRPSKRRAAGPSVASPTRSAPPPKRPAAPRAGNEPSADDEAVVPRPVQGNAPAEIEP